MDIPVEEFVEGLLREGTVDIPSDTKRPDPEDAQFPPWFDEKKFNQGRRFYFNNAFGFTVATFCGLLQVFAVPTILNVLVSTYRSNSVYTAYKRYLATYLHGDYWYRYELKPGSKSWRSLNMVRTRHFHAGVVAKSKNIGVVSQRDISLTLYGFIGFAIVNPDKVGIVSTDPADWDGLIHFWRTVGYMIGLEDKYNICRKNIEESREVFQMIHDRVVTPTMENPPEHFEHMTRVMLDGMWNVNPLSDTSIIFFAKYLSDVPGYFLTEGQRISFQTKLRKINKERGMPLDTPVDTDILLPKTPIKGLPALPPRVFDPKDYSSWASIPAYNDLSWYEKLKVNTLATMCFIATNKYGRMALNLYTRWVVFIMEYFPYYAFLKYGVKDSFAEMFKISPADDVYPMKNEEFYRKKAELPWYRRIFYGLIDNGL